MAFFRALALSAIILQLLLIGLVASATNSTNSCYKCSTINDENCKNKVDCDFATDNECVVYQYHNVTGNINVTIRDCLPQKFCSQYNSTETETLIMCNECNDANNCNKKLSTKSCIQCDSGNGDKWCNDDNADADDATYCSLDEIVHPECVAYRYLKEGKIYTYRGCASKNPCNVASSNTVSCESCSDDKCNTNITLPSDKTCIKCNSLNNTECAKDDMNLKKIDEYCFMEDPMGCVSQKYWDVNSSTIVTFRSCESTDFCSTDSKLNTILCNQCNGTNCNQKIDTKNEKNVCVKCQDEEGSACADTNVDLTKVDFCTINVDKSECFAYKYLMAGKNMTQRGCASKNSCTTLENKQTNIIACNSCNKNHNCNRNVSLTDEKTLCVQCSSTNDGYCSADDMSWSKVETYCSLDNTTECVAYKYFDVSTEDIIVYRGCAQKNHCNTILKSESDNVTVCNECSETGCNKLIDHRTESILCAVCTGEEGSNCASGDKVDLSNDVTLCRLDNNQECIANKYISGSKIITQRGCAEKNFCTNTTSNSTVCKSCSDYNNCNLDLSLSDQATLCIQCSSEDDSECAKDDMNSNKVNEYCRLDKSTNCVAYKFLNGLTGNISTYRGCAQTGYCKNAVLSSNKTMCNECSGNICNKKMDTTKQQTLCVQCQGLEGSSCDITSVNLTEAKYCRIDAGKKECVAYTTLEGDKIATIRGCETQGYCENQKNFSERKACNSCNNATICNSNLNLKDEKILCVQCTSETDKNCALDDMDAKKIKTHCKLDSDKTACIAYKFLDQNSNKQVTVRGCVATEESSACANLPITKNATLQNCFACTGDICNLRLVPPTTTTSTISPTSTHSSNGAPTITNLGIVFFIFLANVLIRA